MRTVELLITKQVTPPKYHFSPALQGLVWCVVTPCKNEWKGEHATL